MPLFRFDKLVRDGIPRIIEDQGVSPHLRVLAGTALHEALRRKLDEELAEFDGAATDDARAEELADMLEVLLGLAAAHGVTSAALEQLRADKAAARGAFAEGLFIDFVTVPNGNPAVETYRRHPDKYPEMDEEER